MAKLLDKDFRSAVAVNSTAHIEQPIQLTTARSGGAYASIHSSHKRAMLNQIIFCTKCGLYCINKAEGLRMQCRGPPKNNYGKAQLKKLLSGKHPVRGAVSWPDGSDAKVTYRPIRLDVL